MAEPSGTDMSNPFDQAELDRALTDMTWLEIGFIVDEITILTKALSQPSPCIPLVVRRLNSIAESLRQFLDAADRQGYSPPSSDQLEEQSDAA
jgi:hypothetical protein